MLVATGGALGAVLRYFLTNISKSLFLSTIYGTFSVNIVGSFLIGYFITSDFGTNLSENFIKFFLIIGVLGSFTTFSAFSFEVLELLQNNRFSLSLIYVMLSLVLCVFAAFLGLNFHKIIN